MHLNNPLLVIGQYNMKGVFIVGASGAGKTTLAHALADHYRYFFGK
jgi:predicted PilT family ATPase